MVHNVQRDKEQEYRVQLSCSEQKTNLRAEGIVRKYDIHCRKGSRGETSFWLRIVFHRSAGHLEDKVTWSTNTTIWSVWLPLLEPLLLQIAWTGLRIISSFLLFSFHTPFNHTKFNRALLCRPFYSDSQLSERILFTDVNKSVPNYSVAFVNRVGSKSSSYCHLPPPFTATSNYIQGTTSRKIHPIFARRYV